jgi:NAD(P)H-dependent flavin oxidoreductase YrpB (nitropropane dioxygenase family)
MGVVAGARMVSAAAEAGALGILPIWLLRPAEAVALIKATRALTERRFAVNIRADLNQHDLIAAAADEGIALFHLFWGDPGSSASIVRSRAGRLLVTVSDADTTKAALDAGAAGLIAQGVEAGGHVFGTMPLAELVPLVVDLAGEVPVAAAGGLVERSDVERALALGASAAVIGTRLVATEESEAHPRYKQALVQAHPGDAVLTGCFDIGWPDAPHRVLRNDTLSTWERSGRPPSGSRPGEGEITMHNGEASFPRYHCMPPHVGMIGDVDAAALYAGCGVGRIPRISSVAEVINELAGDGRFIRAG